MILCLSVLLSFSTFQLIIVEREELARKLQDTERLPPLEKKIFHVLSNCQYLTCASMI